MKNGLMVYKTNFETNIFNIGDYIQSLAAAQFFDGIDCYINRELLNSYEGEDVKLIMNGWFMHCPQNWPPSSYIYPLFVAFHLNKLVEPQLLSLESIAYFKKYEPIGCRDFHTVELLQGLGVKSYFSGCLTLTLGQTYSAKRIRNKSIYFVDIPNPISLTFSSLCGAFNNLLFMFREVNSIYYKKHRVFNLWKYVRNLFFVTRYMSLFSFEVLQNAHYVEQEIDDSFATDDEKFEYAKQLLQNYSQAAFVVTSRIHCALPCLGLETPVLYVYNPEAGEVGNCRMGGLIDLLHTIVIDKDRISCEIAKNKIGEDFSFTNKVLYKKYMNRLIDTCTRFTSSN